MGYHGIMLHRDYILRMVQRFVRVLLPALERIEETGDALAITEMEGAIAELVELEPVMLLSLTPDSLTTFVALSPNADAVAPYMVWGLRRVAEACERVGDEFTARLRGQQADAVAAAFGLEPDVVPEDVAEALDEE